MPKSVEKCEKRGVLVMCWSDVLGSWGDVLGSWGDGLKGCLGEAERAERRRKVTKSLEKWQKVPTSGGK